MTAPEVSETVPLKLAVVNCPNAAVAHTERAHKKTAIVAKDRCAKWNMFSLLNNSIAELSRVFALLIYSMRQ